MSDYHALSGPVCPDCKTLVSQCRCVEPQYPRGAIRQIGLREYLRGLRDVREALWQNDLFDCECECYHPGDEHDDTCGDLCDACTLDGVITALIEKAKS